MEQIELSSTPRTVVGKQVRALRRQGIVPVVVYGAHTEPMLLQASNKELTRVLRQAGGSRLIKVSAGGKTHMTLAREIQREPISGQILHIDLLAVSMTELLRTAVPLSLDGKSPAVRRGEGVLLTGLDSIEIECLPTDLPDRIRVDLGGLEKVGDAIYVKDLQVPDTIKILTEPDEMVARITYLTAEEVPAVAPTTTEAAEPEVIVRGKVEEEEEAEEK
jgi:large subunit ribosomal protein L25